MKSSNILIRMFLNSWSDNFNIPAIIDYDSDAWSVSSNAFFAF